MRLIETSLPGLAVVEPRVHADDRGFFLESFRADRLAELGIRDEWVQDNHARSVRGVLRGMHFALPPGQVKLVRCARGAIMDVCVDIRVGSPTFGRWEAVRLDDEALRELYVPIGFAHGYVVLSEVADVCYRCSSYYDPALEREISAHDPDLGIDWPDMPVVLSDRDRAAPRLSEVAAVLPFRFGGA
jgi:dTDP-4-dehydrorhamnose 3,5-epimerase